MKLSKREVDSSNTGNNISNDIIISEILTFLNNRLISCDRITKTLILLTGNKTEYAKERLKEIKVTIFTFKKTKTTPVSSTN